MLPEILQNIDIEQVQILNEQQMQESIATNPGGNSGQCRPKPSC
ncbi:hypothetical protein BGP_2853 [Beggiatoa sp. PS]|nr:hypothetical protein BGP_2853 [Beggiatoa sp. PS]